MHFTQIHSLCASLKANTTQFKCAIFFNLLLTSDNFATYSKLLATYFKLKFTNPD